LGNFYWGWGGSLRSAPASHPQNLFPIHEHRRPRRPACHGNHNDHRSGQFVEHARRLATLFGYGPGELGEALESLAGWWLQALHEDDGGELTAAAESHFWRSELACSEFAERLRQRIPEATIEVLREHRGWSVEVTPPGMIDSGQAVA
jgi:hypothetical protein